MSDQPIIELKDVSYRYPSARHQILHHISLRFLPGEIYGVIGANDSGKTTFCNVIRGFCPSFFGGDLTGQVLYKGVNINKFQADIAQNIGIIFQDPFVQLSHEKSTVYEEIAYGLENLGRPVDEIRSRVEEVMTQLSISELYNKNPLRLSGGQTQKVAIASIMALNPEVYVFDEPTSSLDPMATSEIFNIFRLLKQQGKTVIVVEHKTNLLAEVSDCLIALAKGKVIAVGSAKKVLNDPKVQTAGINLPAALKLSRLIKQPHQPFATIDEAVQELRVMING